MLSADLETLRGSLVDLARGCEPPTLGVLGCLARMAEDCQRQAVAMEDGLVPPTAPTSCPDCGALVPASGVYCPACRCPIPVSADYDDPDPETLARLAEVPDWDVLAEHISVSGAGGCDDRLPVIDLSDALTQGEKAARVRALTDARIRADAQAEAEAAPDNVVSLHLHGTPQPTGGHVA